MKLRRPALPLALALGCLGLPGPASAHGLLLIGPDDLDMAWSLDPLVLVPLALVHWLYGRGLARIWRRAGIGRGVARWQAACFLAGEAALVLALVWPFDALGQTLFSAHMAQHMLLTTAAAPLLVLGAPLVPILTALPEGWRAHAARWVLEGPPARILAPLCRPMPSTLLHAAALWAWHAPALFEAALLDPMLHALEHATFFATALAFWWAMAHSPRRGPSGPGIAAVWMLVTVVQGGLLGALLTFAGRQLYPGYGDAPTLWGLSPVEDQALAGLIMWVPACLVQIGAGVALVARWLGGVERSARTAGNPW
jgi:putative membrane protein